MMARRIEGEQPGLSGRREKPEKKRDWDARAKKTMEEESGYRLKRRRNGRR